MSQILPKYYFSGEFADFYPMLRSLRGREVRFRTGEFLWKIGEPVTTIFYFRSGTQFLLVQKTQ